MGWGARAPFLSPALVWESPSVTVTVTSQAASSEAPPPSCFGPKGGRALRWLHFLRLRATSPEAFPPTPLPWAQPPSEGDGPHWAAGPRLWKRERESTLPEGVGTHTGWREQDRSRCLGRGGLSEWHEPSPVHHCVTLRSHSVPQQDAGCLEREGQGSALHIFIPIPGEGRCVEHILYHSPQELWEGPITALPS